MHYEKMKRFTIAFWSLIFSSKFLCKEFATNSFDQEQKSDTVSSTFTEGGPSRIINGSPVAPNAYPFFAHRYYSNSPAHCGGSLIAQNWILTAAHCIDNPKFSDGSMMLQWRVGSLCTDQGVDENCGGRVTLAETAKVVIHRKYKGFHYDIGLVRLDRVVDERSVSLDDGRIFYDLKQGDSVKSIGMGLMTGGVMAHHLQEVDNLFLPPKKCRHRHKSVMCTNGANFGTCRGDSGSPNLVWDKTTPTGWRQVGVTSFGAGNCENNDAPDGLARVARVYKWIAKKVCKNYLGETPDYCTPVLT